MVKVNLTSAYHFLIVNLLVVKGDGASHFGLLQEMEGYRSLPEGHSYHFQR